MKFEEAIKTKKFQSENQKAQLNVIHTASVLKCYFTAFFNRFDLSMEQYNVLRIVRGQMPKPVKVKEISERILHRNSNTTRIIDKLEDKSLIIREEATKDRRAVHVILTPKGVALMDEIDQAIAEKSPHIKALEESEAEVLSLLLDKMRMDFDKHSK